MLIHPLIKTQYIHPLEYYQDHVGNPFDFPMNLDDSAVNAKDEMILLVGFLSQHSKAAITLVNYSKEAEKYCQWLWRIKKKDMLKINRSDAVEFVEFIKSPPYHWISRRGTPQKFLRTGEPCLSWRPFSAKSNGVFTPSKRSVAATVTVIRGVYNFLIDEGLTEVNPFYKI